MNAAPKGRATRSSPQTTWKEPTSPAQEQLSLESYRAEMSTAARKAGERAARVADPDAFDAALDAIRLRSLTGEWFDADDIRGDLGNTGTGSIGAAFAQASRRGWIVQVGTDTSKAVTRHGGLTRVWAGRP